MHVFTSFHLSKEFYRYFTSKPAILFQFLSPFSPCFIPRWEIPDESTPSRDLKICRLICHLILIHYPKTQSQRPALHIWKGLEQMVELGVAFIFTMHVWMICIDMIWILYIYRNREHTQYDLGHGFGAKFSKGKEVSCCFWTTTLSNTILEKDMNSKLYKCER